jgi:hypothetical protein
MALTLDDRLVLKRLRLIVRRERAEDGSETLHLFYGPHQISFDEPELIPFGERLAEHESFRAGDALEWSGLDWDQLRELLERLVEIDVLQVAGQPSRTPPPPAPLTAAVAAPAPIAWHAPDELCQRIAALVEAPVPLELLEAVAECGTVVQSLRDEAGRQIGENSLAVRLPELAEPVPTDWRTCRYPGSRFEEARPMNVSALRQVRAHFDAVLAGITAMRRRLLAGTGRPSLDVVHVTLLTEVLSFMPAWLFLRRDGRVANGALAAWVASLSKTVAGVRITAAHMCFRSSEHGPGATPTASELMRVTEESGFFMTASGTCSGPPAMVLRTLRVCVGEEDVEGGESILATLGDPARALAVGLRASRVRNVDTRMIAWTRALLEEAAPRGPAHDDDASGRRVLVGVDAMAEAIAALDAAGEPASTPPPDWSTALPALLEAVEVPSPDVPDVPETPDMPDTVAATGAALLAVLGAEWSSIAALDQAQAALGTLLGRRRGWLSRADVARARALDRRDLDGDRLARRLGLRIEEARGYTLVSRAGRVELPVADAGRR